MTKINQSLFRCCMVIFLTVSQLMNAQFGPMPGAGSMGMPAMPGGAQGMGGPGFGGPGQAGPAAGMPMPSEQELEQILKMIEQAAAENPELIKEWERQGQREILRMSEADLAAFGQMVGIAPEVLREEAEKALADELGAAAVPAPQAAASREEEFIPQRPSAAQKIEQPKPSKGDTHQTGALIKGLIKNLAELQAKAASVREVHELIRAWLQELRELMFYMNVVDRLEYHEHLSLPKFKGLASALGSLYNVLRTEVPHIVLPDDLLEEPTAYDLLGVKKSAKDTVIDAAYEKLVEKHNPKKLEKELRAQGLDEKAIKQQVKKATLSFEAVEDAYEQLHDPQVRAQVDREIESHKSSKQHKIDQATQALKKIRHALEDAVYGNEILFALEEFLHDYAPQQLALKKTIEEAEKKHLEEQKKHAAIRPTSTYGHFEPEVRYTPSSEYDDYGYGSNFNPYSDYGNYYDNYPDYSYSSDSDYGKPSKGAGTEGEKDKEKKEEKEKEEKTGGGGKAPSAKDVADAFKIDPRTPDEIIKSIDKNFDEFIKNYVKDPAMKTHYQTILDGFSKNLKSAPTPATTPATTTQLTAEEQARLDELDKAPKPLTKKDFQEKQDLEKKKSATEITLPSGSDIPKHFEDFRKNLKLDVLAHDIENLKKVFRTLDSKSADQEKALKKLAKKIEEHEDVIPNLKATIASLKSDVDNSGVKNNIDAYKKLSDDLVTIDAYFRKLQESYTSKI